MVVFGKAVVFVYIVCIPWIVNPPVVYGDAAEIGNAFGDFTCFGFDFFVQYGDADGAEVFFEQLCQAKFHGNAAVVHFVDNKDVLTP